MPERSTFVEKIIEWTGLKCRIQTDSEIEFYFKEREIWWASIGMNIGSETYGKHERFERPVLVLKKFSKYLILAIPATSQVRDDLHHFYSLSGEKPQSFILSQIRAMSPKRLLRKQRSMPSLEFDRLRERLKDMI